MKETPERDENDSGTRCHCRLQPLGLGCRPVGDLQGRASQRRHLRQRQIDPRSRPRSAAASVGRPFAHCRCHAQHHTQRSQRDLPFAYCVSGRYPHIQHQRLFDHAVPAAVPLDQLADLRAIQAGRDAVRSPVCASRTGPFCARGASLLRHPQRPGQPDGGAGEKDRHFGTVGPGQAQFRGRHLDHCRHQRGAVALRPGDRRGIGRAERPRSQAHGAAFDHRQAGRRVVAAAYGRGNSAATAGADRQVGQRRRERQLCGQGPGSCG